MNLFSKRFKKRRKSDIEYLEFLLAKLERTKAEKAVLETGENDRFTELQKQIEREKEKKVGLNKCKLPNAGLTNGKSRVKLYT